LLRPPVAAAVGGTPAEVPGIYHDRSPVNSAEKITAPTLLLQGLDDKVVPPDQAATMAKKIESVGGKVEVVYYEGAFCASGGAADPETDRLADHDLPGEGHGFRQAKNIKDALDRSRAFLEKTWGIKPAQNDGSA
jgi:dipeptidyl aminopeptidase/acylaminoacyl peptidase